MSTPAFLAAAAEELCRGDALAVVCRGLGASVHLCAEVAEAVAALHARKAACGT